jgi:hypothetical protein
MVPPAGNCQRRLDSRTTFSSAQALIAVHAFCELEAIELLERKTLPAIKGASSKTRYGSLRQMVIRV